MKNRPLRSGFTTGACAAAAAKAAAQMLSDPSFGAQRSISIPFPDGDRHAFEISSCGRKGDSIYASVIKDAGDDPDVTNGAEITATVRALYDSEGIIIKGGSGIGLATKPGLPVKAGEPAINPVPRKMLKDALMESSFFTKRDPGLPKGIEVTLSITDGERLAKKTLNHRLGIVGGLSVLGTTGIVRPLSAEAWTATIVASMDVAKATGQREIVLSTGRTSENAHKRCFNLPEECYVMMGDYIEFAIKEAEGHRFEAVHLSAQWAKMLKIAMGIAQTHVRFGAIEVNRAIEFLCSLQQDSGLNSLLKGRRFNTAREAFELLQGGDLDTGQRFIYGLLGRTARHLKKMIKVPLLIVHLVSYDNRIVASLEAP